MGSNDLINEYGECQNIILGPCLAMLQKLRQQLEAPGASPEVLKQVLACLRLIARIFYSLNGMGLTEVRRAGHDVMLVCDDACRGALRWWWCDAGV